MTKKFFVLKINWFQQVLLPMSYLTSLVFSSEISFLYSTFLFCFIMQTLAIISSINNFNKHALIDHFHFKHETRIKEKLLN